MRTTTGGGTQPPAPGDTTPPPDGGHGGRQQPRTYFSRAEFGPATAYVDVFALDARGTIAHSKSALQVPRVNPQAAALGHLIIVAGGSYETTGCPVVELFDTRVMRWLPPVQLPAFDSADSLRLFATRKSAVFMIAAQQAPVLLKRLVLRDLAQLESWRVRDADMIGTPSPAPV